MRSYLSRWALGGVVLFAPCLVVAQTPTSSYPVCTVTPTDADQKAAKGAFDAGTGSFNEADYATAITYWKDAYRRDCTAHLLLLNLARAYEAKGEKGEAIKALETYLQRRPNDPTADQIQRRIQNLKAQANPEPAATASAAPVAALLPPPVSSAPPAAVEAPSGSRGHSVAPWIVVGAGGLLTIIGLADYSAGKSKIADVEAKCPGRVCKPSDLTGGPAEAAQLEQKGTDGVKQANTGGALAWIGLIAVGGGLVWHFAFDKGSDASVTPKTTLAPVTGKGFAGLVVNGEF